MAVLAGSKRSAQTIRDTGAQLDVRRYQALSARLAGPSYKCHPCLQNVRCETAALPVSIVLPVGRDGSAYAAENNWKTVHRGRVAWLPRKALRLGAQRARRCVLALICADGRPR